MSGKVKPVVNCGQTSQTRRRLDAGETRHGGTARVSPTGDQTRGGGHLRAPGTRAHLVVAVVGAGMAENDDGGGRGGSRSSGVRGTGAAVRKRARRDTRETLRVEVSMLDARPRPNGHRSCVGDELVRRRASGINGNCGYGGR